MAMGEHGQGVEIGDPSAVAGLLRGLADPGRLTILAHLFTGEHNVRELTDHVGLAQSTVSAHLASLRGCGLVTSRPEGRASMYAVAHPIHTRALLETVGELLGAVEQASDEGGTA